MTEPVTFITQPTRGPALRGGDPETPTSWGARGVSLKAQPTGGLGVPPPPPRQHAQGSLGGKQSRV